MTDFKIGNLVRFANEQDGGPVHRVVSVMSDGMVELHDLGGYFAPHLFVEATDVAGIPLAIAPAAGTDATPLQIAQRLKDAVHSLRPGQEKPMHADMLRAANLIIAAVPIISECREELFDSHQVNGVVTVTEDIDRDAIRMLDYMDYWLSGINCAEGRSNA